MPIGPCLKPIFTPWIRNKCGTVVVPMRATAVAVSLVDFGGSLVLEVLPSEPRGDYASIIYWIVVIAATVQGPCGGFNLRSEVEVEF